MGRREDLFAELKSIKNELEKITLKGLFKENPKRFEEFSVSLENMILDYSKININKDAISKLFEVAKECKVEEKRDAMFSGEKINITENRAVLHTALRNKSDNQIFVDGKDVMPDIKEVLQNMKEFATSIRDGKILSSTNEKFTDIINIGIGGSHLGPEMVSQALTPYCDGPKVHFVSNIDSSHLSDTIKDLNPATTLVIVASKTFTTIETMTNAKSAKKWLQESLGEKEANLHFAALSTALEKTKEFGISDDRVFGFWDWVGGRYSIWSAIGLSVMIAIGADSFDEFLEGAFIMDEHFKAAPIEKNMPMLLGLIGIWHRNICDYDTRAILPYDQRLRSFAMYVQQLDMESNGKRVTLSGEELKIKSGPIVWGEPGTNSQHSFFQLLHQGKDIIPCEFMLAVNNHENGMDIHNDLLMANCLAQSQAMMNGRDIDEVRTILKDSGLCEEKIEELAPHKVFEGNRPSSTLIYKKLDPKTLGEIIALYEHRVFVEGAIWDVGSFDQWGVELGKELATKMVSYIQDDSKDTKLLDSSSKGLLDTIKLWNKNQKG
ncbi:glucose-6-phosphate isomerase [Arcobacter arenosus]|uniref:glucose-6-phosphate isomerase n=1 Tax=Arcobacter arenosus TaxID=2576037 RepID=UPI003BADB12B